MITAVSGFPYLANALLDLPQDGSRNNQVHEAARYVLSGAGKLLRGRLVLSLALDLGSVSQEEMALPAAVAVEYLHAASLVHDDLPALDNDDFRRGKPSCHKAFSEATAILVGDYLTGAAFEQLSRLNVSGERLAFAARVASRTWMQLCSGQQVDLSLAGQVGEAVSPAAFEEMMRLKTGALFGCSAALGALVGGAPLELCDAFFTWGVDLGVLFQQIDNVLDNESSFDSLSGLEEDCHRLEGRLSEMAKGQGAPAPAALEMVKSITSLDRFVKAA
jgi:geranylgeranyl diphosphate synthase type II